MRDGIHCIVHAHTKIHMATLFPTSHRRLREEVDRRTEGRNGKTSEMNLVWKNYSKRTSEVNCNRVGCKL